MSRGIDWLTMSVSTSVGKVLCEQTDFDELGSAQKGFKSSERRLCLGGKCWRKTEPHRPCIMFGEEYESWEWSGEVARWPSDFLIAYDECKPSRIDIAFDFACDQSLLADHIIERCKPWIKRKRISIGISGKDDINTRYVGSEQSERRVRIYRRDLKHAGIAAVLGPVLRFELIVKDDRAVEWWQEWRQDKELALAGAAWHINAMMGIAIQEAMHEVPRLEMPESIDEAQRLYRFIQQHGDTLAILADAGVPMLDLAREHAARKTNRMRNIRQDKRRKALSQLDIDELASIVRRIAAGRMRVVAGEQDISGASDAEHSLTRTAAINPPEP